MLDIERMNKIDSKGMYKIYDRWPEIAKEAFESNLESVTMITAKATAKKLPNFIAELPKLNFEEVFNVFSCRL